MAEAMLIGAGLGAGTALLTGNDPVKSAAIGGAMGGVGNQLSSNPFTSQGLQSASQSTMPSHLTSDAVSSTIANGTMNPALTNSIGQSSNPFTQLSRDAYENVGQHVDGAFNSVTDTIGSGFDYINDKTGMENKDWTQMAMNQGINSMQHTPEAPIQHAPMGSGISRPNVDLSKTAGSLLTSNPLLQEKLRQQGLL